MAKMKAVQPEMLAIRERFMNKHGAKIELWDNLMELLGRKDKDDKNNKDKSNVLAC